MTGDRVYWVILRICVTYFTEFTAFWYGCYKLSVFIKLTSPNSYVSFGYVI